MFKTFAAKCFRGCDSNGISFALDEICRMETFRTSHLFTFDISDVFGSAQEKRNFSVWYK